MFQISLDPELYNRVARSPTFLLKYEKHVTSEAALAKTKQIVLTFSDSADEAEIVKFFKNFGPVVKKTQGVSHESKRTGKRASESGLHT